MRARWAAPVVCCKAMPRTTDAAGDFDHHLRRNATFVGGVLRREASIVGLERLNKLLKLQWALRMQRAQIVLPVYPTAQEIGIVKLLGQNNRGHRQQRGGFCSRSR